MTKKSVFFSLFAMFLFSVGKASDAPKTAEKAMQIMASPNVVFTDKDLIESQGFGPDVIGKCRGILNVGLIRNKEEQIKKVKELLRDSGKDPKIMQLICLAGLGEVLKVASEMIEKEREINIPVYSINKISSVGDENFVSTFQENQQEEDGELIHFNIGAPENIPNYGTPSDLTPQQNQEEQNLKKVVGLKKTAKRKIQEVEEEGENEDDRSIEKIRLDEIEKKSKEKREQNIKLFKKYAPIAGSVGAGLFVVWKYFCNKQ